MNQITQKLGHLKNLYEHEEITTKRVPKKGIFSCGKKTITTTSRSSERTAKVALMINDCVKNAHLLSIEDKISLGSIAEKFQISEKKILKKTLNHQQKKRSKIFTEAIGIGLDAAKQKQRQTLLDSSRPYYKDDVVMGLSPQIKAYNERKHSLTEKHGKVLSITENYLYHSVLNYKNQISQIRQRYENKCLQAKSMEEVSRIVPDYNQEFSLKKPEFDLKWGSIKKFMAKDALNEQEFNAFLAALNGEEPENENLQNPKPDKGTELAKKWALKAFTEAVPVAKVPLQLYKAGTTAQDAVECYNNGDTLGLLKKAAPLVVGTAAMAIGGPVIGGAIAAYQAYALVNLVSETVDYWNQ